MTLQPIRLCRIWCTTLLVALSLAYLPEWAPLFASGPHATRPATRHERTAAFGDAVHGVQQPDSGGGRALFQAKIRASSSAGSRTGGGKPRKQAARRRSGGVQHDSDGEETAVPGRAAATCKVPEAVKPRRAAATTVKPSAQKCRAACR